MLTHALGRPAAPDRVVVLGAGFIGGAAADLMEKAGASVLRLGRRDLDLATDGAASRLTDLLGPRDCMVVTSAVAPCKTNDMLVDNVRMMRAVCGALQKVTVAHVLYVSSDAVYRDSAEALSEDSCAEPGSLHGAMHLVRERMLREVVADRLAILRPTLVYGAGDPHNGYGPNRFLRLAAKGEPIVLFGDGEERRDHVWIRDVAALVQRMVWHRSVGILNAATGTVRSFRDVAQLVAARFDPRPSIKATPRHGPMPHDGYRPFRPDGTFAAFPDFRYADMADVLATLSLP